MTCRAPSSSATCTGSSPTGQGLSYDNEGQLIGWTSALHGQPTPNTASFAYDDEGARVAQQSTAAGTITTTWYVAGLEDIAKTRGLSGTTLTEYESVPGLCSVLIVSSGGRRRACARIGAAREETGNDRAVPLPPD